MRINVAVCVPKVHEHAQPLPLRAPSTIALHLLQYVNSLWARRLLSSHREHDFLRALLRFHIVDDFASEKMYIWMNPPL